MKSNRILLLVIAILTVFALSFGLTACGGANDNAGDSGNGDTSNNSGGDNNNGNEDQNNASDKLTITGAEIVEGGELNIVMSNGVKLGGVKLPENSENIYFKSAFIQNGSLVIYLSDEYYMTTAALPSLDKNTSELNLKLDEKNLILEADGKEYDLGQVYYPTVPGEELTPGGASEYTESRDVSERNTAEVIIKVRGYGEITLLLDATTAPITVENFISLAKSGFYDGLTFHRIISGFMIQGGDPKADGTGGSDEDIFGEFDENGWTNDISHKKGVISMARANDPNSGSSQFFICNADATSLDGKYAAFGYVTSGLNIVDEITALTVPYTDYYSGTIADKAKQVVIESVTITKDIER